MMVLIRLIIFYEIYLALSDTKQLGGFVMDRKNVFRSDCTMTQSNQVCESDALERFIDNTKGT